MGDVVNCCEIVNGLFQYIDFLLQNTPFQRLLGGFLVVVFLFLLSLVYKRWLELVKRNLDSSYRYWKYLLAILIFMVFLNIIGYATLSYEYYYEQEANRTVSLFVALGGIVIANIAVFSLGRICFSRIIDTDEKGEIKRFWDILFISFTLVEVLLFVMFFIPGRGFFLLPKLYLGIIEFCEDWVLPVIVGIVAWLTYIANSESIDRPYFSVFFIDESMYNQPNSNSKKKNNQYGENEKKIVEVIPWFAGKQPLNYAENEEFTISICIKNTAPPNSVLRKGAPGSKVTAFFYMPTNIVPFRATRYDLVTENRQVFESCSYGLFKNRSYIAVPVAYNASPPAITMMSREEAVVVTITSRIEKPLNDEYCECLQSIGIQITSNEGITSDVKWLYLKFCKVEIQ